MRAVSSVSLLKRFGPVVRAGRSAKWLGRLLGLWRSPNRLFLSIPPGHYYSPLPDVLEVERAAVFDTDRTELPGLDLGRDRQLALLEELARYQREMPFGDAPQPDLRYHLDNTFFPYPDGVTLYSLLRHLRPARVVEVGSGYSSAVMLDTDERFLGGRTEFTFIDPDPGRLHQLLRPADRSRCRVIPERVQAVPAEVFDALTAGDWLFIDSSHVSKIGSDVNHLFFELLPRLAAGVVVHVHDVFWPFEYPRHWFEQGIAWNEAYLLRGVLTGGRRYRILFFPSYLERHAAAEWAATMPRATGRAVSNPLTGAASIYLVVTDD